MLTAACGPGVHRTVIGPAYSPLAPEAEVFVSSLVDLQCPFGEAELVTVRGREFNDQRDFLPVLKSEAPALGGDGLIGSRHVPPVDDDEAWAGLEATVIRFTDPDCRR